MPVCRLGARATDRQIHAHLLLTPFGHLADGHANLTLQGGSRVERCRAEYFGGAVAVYEGSSAKILEGSVLNECHAETVGGLDIWCPSEACQAEFVESSILNCSSSRSMGGFFFTGSTLLCQNSVAWRDRSNTRISPVARTRAHPWRLLPPPHFSSDCCGLHSEVRCCRKGGRS